GGEEGHNAASYDEANRAVDELCEGSQGRTEVLPPHMESTLEVVLANEEGVQDLQSKLLDLTSKVKSHEVIIQQLKKRMNELEFQISTPIATNNTAPRKDIKDDDVSEWEMEEEAIEDLIIDVFLKDSTAGRTSGLRTSGQRCESIGGPAMMIREARWDANLIQCTECSMKNRRPNQRIARLMPSQNILEVPVEVVILLACIMKNVHINVGEIIADQFRRKSKQQATTFSFPSLVNMLCLRAECPLWHSLDRTIHLHGVITLDTKTDKEAPMIRRARDAGHLTPPSPLASSHIATAPANASAPQISPPPDLLNIVQRVKMRENHLVRLSRAIPSMIQSALKKALQPAKDKLTHLCLKVDVLESEVTTLQQEVAIFTAHTDQPMPYDPEAIPPQVEASRSPPDDWWVGDHNNADIMSEEEELHHSSPLRLKCIRCMMLILRGPRGVWQQHLIMSYGPSQTDGSHQALVYMLNFHQIPCNLRQNTQLLGFLMLSLILGSQDPIANMIMKSHLPSYLSYRFHWGQCLIYVWGRD
ncbi:hypothetical protein HAX54_024933, partial [Datura stramonium]|nr:hypothetical protein [Datura stramonium]